MAESDKKELKYPSYWSNLLSQFQEDSEVLSKTFTDGDALTSTVEAGREEFFKCLQDQEPTFKRASANKIFAAIQRAQESPSIPYRTRRPSDYGQEKKYPPKTYLCKICNKPGHYVYDCPKKRDSSSAGGSSRGYGRSRYESSNNSYSNSHNNDYNQSSSYRGGRGTTSRPQRGGGSTSSSLSRGGRGGRGGSYLDYSNQSSQPEVYSDVGRCFSFETYGTCRYGDTCKFSHDGAADKGDGDPSSRKCRHFMQGRQCPKGDRCKFSHDMSDFVPRKPCRYWEGGKCFRGKDCTFLHAGEPGGGNVTSDSHRSSTRRSKSPDDYPIEKRSKHYHRDSDYHSPQRSRSPLSD